MNERMAEMKLLFVCDPTKAAASIHARHSLLSICEIMDIEVICYVSTSEFSDAEIANGLHDYLLELKPEFVVACHGAWIYLQPHFWTWKPKNVLLFSPCELDTQLIPFDCTVIDGDADYFVRQSQLVVALSR